MRKIVFRLEENEVPEVDRKLAAISAQDETFRYSIKKYRDGYFLVIRCRNADIAHRRALWVRDKIFGNDRLYWVK